MKIFFTILTLSIFYTSVSFAQSKDGNTATTTAVADDSQSKNYYTYIGVQSNLLFKQFININSNAFINTNPFTFEFSMVNRKSGRGFGLGAGFDFSTNTANDGVQSTTIKNRVLALRAGYEKKYLQNQKWIPSWGVDGSMGVVYNETSSVLIQTNPSTTTITSINGFFGPTLHGGIAYAIAPHILIGTEANLNFRIGVTSINVTGTTIQNQSNQTSIGDIGLNTPTAIFLIVRF